MDDFLQLYNDWVRTAIRPSPDDCPLSAAECLLKGKPCALRHVSIIQAEEFFKRIFFGELVAAIQKFKEQYPLQDAQYLLPNAFSQVKDRKQYQKQKKKRDFHLHLVNDHTLESYDVHCDELLGEKCRLLGYVEKPQNRAFINKCKKIKKGCRLKKDDSFLNECLGFGQFKQRTWSYVQKFNPQYIDWVSNYFFSDVWEREKARIIISRRDEARRKREIEQMKRDLSFMDLYLGTGKHRGKSWREVQQIDPTYIDWARYNAPNLDWVDFARIIKSKRTRVQVKSE